MALTDEEFRAWCQRNQIEAETITYLHRIRTSDASQPFFYALDQTTPRHGGCPFVRAHLDHSELDIVLTRTPNTEQRWAMEKTIWEVVGEERK